MKLASLIKEIMTESVYDKGIFKAIFFAGIPGAGKTYTINQVTDGQISPRVVNFDKYAEFLGKKLGIKDVGGVVEQTFIDKTKQLTTKQLALYINSMLPLFVDSTSNKINRTVYRDGMLRSFGYDTGMVWVETPLEVALERIRSRNRSVPEAFVQAVYTQLQENMEYYKTNFSFFYVVKNNRGELTNEALLEAFRSVSKFFQEPIKNPIGQRNKEAAEKTSGYLTPYAYRDIEKIHSKLTNWY